MSAALRLPEALAIALLAGNTDDQKQQFQALADLNSTALDLLKSQPSLHSVVHYELGVAFASLAPPLDPDQTYINIDSRGSSDEVAGMVDLRLAPTVIDTVLERLVSGVAPTYDTGLTTIPARRSLGGEAQAPQTLDVIRFERFIDDVGQHLARYCRRQFDDFWNGQSRSTEPVRRKDRLIKLRAEQLRAEAQLLSLDGTLAPTSTLLIEQMLRYPTVAGRGAMPTSQRAAAYSLSLKVEGVPVQVPLAGAWVLTSRDGSGVFDEYGSFSIAPKKGEITIDSSTDVGHVVLFTPTRGLEAFTSLQTLNEALERRWRSSIEFEFMLELVAEPHLAQVLALDNGPDSTLAVTYTEIQGHVFEAAFEAQQIRQRQNLAHALQSGKAHGSAIELQARLNKACDWTGMLDLSSILAARETKRVQTQLAAWLKGASDHDRQAWFEAVEAYEALRSVSQVPGLPSVDQYGDQRFLHAYAREQLQARILAMHGIEVDPDRVFMTTTAARQTGAIIPPSAWGTSAYTVVNSLPRTGPTLTPVHTSRTLTELALENIGALDIDYALTAHLTHERPDGPLYTQLSSGEIKDIVRTVNVGQRYEDFLTERLLTSPAAQAEKEGYAALMGAQMRVDALEAKISGDFSADRLERGYQWVQAVLERPQDDGQRATVEGHRIRVYQLVIEGATVRSVLIIAPAREQSVESLVVYTPDAPGGRRFREFENRAGMVREMLGATALHDYLVQRVSLAQQDSVRRLLNRGVRGSEVSLPGIEGHFLEQAYQAEARYAIANANARSTSTYESNLRTGWNSVETAVDVVSFILPCKVLLPIALGRSVLSVWMGFDALRRESKEEALRHYLTAIAHLVDAATDGASAIARRVPRQPGSGTSGLEPRWAYKKTLTGLRPSRFPGVHEKVPREGGYYQYFIHQAGHWYQVLYDTDRLAWRLMDWRCPQAYYRRPVARNAQGLWEVHSPLLGLKGGGKSYVAPHRILVAFPHFRLAQAKAFLNRYAFPHDAQARMEIELAEYLVKHKTPPAWSRKYLKPVVEEGAAQPGTSTGGATSPVDQRWRDWGQALEATRLAPANTHPRVYRLEGPRSAEVIEIEGRHYEVLPQGSAPRANAVFIKNTAQPSDSYEGLARRITANHYDQPRLAIFSQADGWQVQAPLFHKPIEHFVAKIFPGLTPISQRVLAEKLFDLADESSQGLTHTRLVNISYTLNAWRAGKAAPIATLSDPLAMLSPATSPAGTGHLSISYESALSPFQRLDFVTEAADADVLRQLSGTYQRRVLNQLMRHIVVRNGYELLGGMGVGSPLVFRRPGMAFVHFMPVYKVSKLKFEYYSAHQPLTQKVEQFIANAPTSEAAVALSHARDHGQLVMLCGGLQDTSQFPQRIFVVRVAG